MCSCGYVLGPTHNSLVVGSSPTAHTIESRVCSCRVGNRFERGIAPYRIHLVQLPVKESQILVQGAGKPIISKISRIPNLLTENSPGLNSKILAKFNLVGAVDVMPKLAVYRLQYPTFSLSEDLRILCRKAPSMPFRSIDQ